VSLTLLCEVLEPVYAMRRCVGGIWRRHWASPVRQPRLSQQLHAGRPWDDVQQ